MKKLLIVTATIIIIAMAINKKEEYVIVPNSSIRFRIIPNSNTIEDINMKEKVKNEINDIIKEIEATSTNLETSRENIKTIIPKIENKIDKLFEKENYNKDYKVNYGMNYFPEKIYKGVKYPSGEYESMVIEIGESSGDNYWCVLFPPLCMIEAEETEEVEYKFFISEIIKKFLK
ncbi:MAG: stage II sporulation protein R [Bacilli bacterium]|nr:stage II sporulation protein R [Bacilli bacterium]